MSEIEAEVLAECCALLPGWEGLHPRDVHFEPPKGFSSFTMVVRPRVEVDPPGVLYRRLEGKENAILGGDQERGVYLALSDAGISARCLYVDDRCRLEELLPGSTLTRHDLTDPQLLAAIARELHRFHHLEAPPLPSLPFFDLLHAKWGAMARRVLLEQRDCFPEHERGLCEPLLAIARDETRDKVRRFLPEGPLTFSHNDTYHGNIMGPGGGAVRLLDFEFSCLNHRAFDFSNLFAETVMRHGLADPPHFDIAEPEFGRPEVELLVRPYVELEEGLSPEERRQEVDRLVDETLGMIPLSDYMYAMAALPLAVQPIQKIRFLPYAARRFARFLDAFDQRFG